MHGKSERETFPFQAEPQHADCFPRRQNKTQNSVVLVEADLWVKTIELYSKRWQLAALEYGSGLRFGLRLPIHYQEGRPFDISWSDIEIIKPDLNATDILTGLIKKIA